MYSFDSRIRYSETDADGRLTPEKLIDYFQDCSTFQSEDNGLGVERLRRHGLAWIIVYWRVEVLRMPVLGEQVRIGTLPYAMKGSIGLRNFFMETAGGERLANANSVWSLVDTSTMHPVRIPEEILAGYPLEERLQMQYDARKIRLPDQSGRPMEPIRVQEYHLDTNRHVNNGQYVRMAAGFLPPHTEVSVLRIEYRQQALLGDVIQPVVYTRSEENTGLTTGRADAAAVGNTDGSNTRPMPAEDSRSGAAQTVCIALNAKDGRPYAILEAIF